MSNTGEIKLGKEGYLSSKSFFDTKVGNIKDTQKTFDNGIDLLYKSWTGKAKVQQFQLPTIYIKNIQA